MPLHRAYAIQNELKTAVIREDAFGEIGLVGGVDVAYDVSGNRGCCVIAVFSLPSLEPVCSSPAVGAIGYPYIPGLFAFREGPLVEEAFDRLDIIPDVLIFDGHGICHPRGIGIATHMGIVLDMPSIGCAKTHLFGTYEEPGPLRGDRSPISSQGETIGCVLRTRAAVRPVFVSQGHRIGLVSAVEVCLRCSTRYRIPEPLRQAHLLAGRHLHRSVQH